jgi:purine-binding chemotaxis protein CheW
MARKRRTKKEIEKEVEEAPVEATAEPDAEEARAEAPEEAPVEAAAEPDVEEAPAEASEEAPVEAAAESDAAEARAEAPEEAPIEVAAESDAEQARAEAPEEVAAPGETAPPEAAVATPSLAEPSPEAVAGVGSRPEEGLPGQVIAETEEPAEPPPDARSAPALTFDETKSEELAQVFQQRARALAQIPPKEEEGESLEVVVFSLGEEQYAVRADYVEVIRPLDRWTPVPCTPEFVVGVINLRGRVVSVVDLRRFLGQDGILLEQGAEVMVVKAGPMELGLAVSEVRAVRALRMRDLGPVPSTTQRVAEYALGVTADLLVLLDLEALLDDKRIVVWEEVG